MCVHCAFKNSSGDHMLGKRSPTQLEPWLFYLLFATVSLSGAGTLKLSSSLSLEFAILLPQPPDLYLG